MDNDSYRITAEKINVKLAQSSGGNDESSADEQLHVAIIGSGSAAFACAIKAAEGGAKVTIIEAGEVIGGCCVNVGCVPSKILIRAAQLAQQQRDNPFAGLENNPPIIDRSLISQQQTSRVEELRVAKYQNILLYNPALSLIKGRASFKDAHRLSVTKTDGEIIDVSADRILVATGSTPHIPPIEGLSDTPYWTSEEALFADQTPEHLIIIGSSVVALEIAQAFRRLGSQVTVLARHTLLYKEDPLLGEQLTTVFEREGIQVQTYTQASNISFDGKKFKLQTDRGQLSSDKLLVCTGRKANVAKLNLELAGIKTDRHGCIKVNERMQTSSPHIYGGGDCSSMP